MRRCDVLVVGSGLAGSVAAIEAARSGAQVVVATAAARLSGSSFYLGTWGLGLVGPADDADESDLAAVIGEVGCGMADPALVQALVGGIRPGMAWLEGLGVELARPANDGEAREEAFIPCFDRKTRLWRGITRGSCARAFAAAFERLGIEVWERCELIDLLEGGASAHAADGADADGSGAAGPASRGRVAGAVLFDASTGEVEHVCCGAVVLASGGLSGLFERRLAAEGALGSVQGIALAHGCGLVNIEFLQMMPALVAPCPGVVFNEKTFRYLDGEALAATAPELPRGAELAALLEIRSLHGPASARTGDAAIDRAISAAGAAGLAIRCRFPGGEARQPAFVRAVASWMARDVGVGPEDEVRLGLYAHASNGGLLVDAQGRTGRAGLFACGEVTGGMHGADRLGGLSSANCLVFGRRAGAAAAAFARDGDEVRPDAYGSAAAGTAAGALESVTEEEAARIQRELRHIMTRACMIDRKAVGLAAAAAELAGLAAAATGDGWPLGAAVERACLRHDVPGMARAARLRAQILTARAMVLAMEERRESRGAHLRTDFPAEDPAFARPRIVRVADLRGH